MQRNSIKPSGPGAPMTVPRPGAASSVGPSGKAPAPRIKNTRDYGKTAPSAMPTSPPANPFGPAANTPFAPSGGGGRIGGI